MIEVKQYLMNNQDNEYKEFSQRLNIGKEYKSIGVRLPVLKTYAKQLSKEYSLDYLIKEIDNEYYEEILLKGYIIGNYNSLTYEELIYYIDDHLSKIKDWSMCDSFVTALKITKKYHDKLWDYLLDLLKSKEEFKVRFALVMILNYYINDLYKSKIYSVILKVKNNSYYVKMANSWLISYMIINYFDETIDFIQNNNFDQWTINKGITKAMESRKISNPKKEILRKLRNNKKI